MRRFLLLYWLGIGLFFAIFYWEISPIAPILNNMQTNFTTFLTSLTLPSDMMRGHHITINPHYELVIEKACNGMIPYLFFLASIFAFPSTWRHTLIWALIGYVVIESMNILRIWIVSKMVLMDRDNFSLSHDYLGNIMLMMSVLSLFILFVKTRKKEF